jgi:hypothetical protein
MKPSVLTPLPLILLAALGTFSPKGAKGRVSLAVPT